MYKIWVDETWRWAWFWNLVACSLTFNYKDMPDNDLLSQIKDSKQLTKKNRETIFLKLIELSRWENPKLFFGIWIVDSQTIDNINVKEANKEAMKRSLEELFRKIDKDDIKWVFIDWNDNYIFEWLNIKAKYIIWWDSKVLEIWAASIIAKVFRDKLISSYSYLYPDLGIEKHKWYGTSSHIAYLKDKSNISSLHRISYKPIKKIIEKKEKLLLHVCCGPDASIPILDLKDKFEIICFWYDPNIHPKEEYDKRLENFKKICEIEKIKYIEWEYDSVNFFKKIKWFEHTKERWEKCKICYDMRLEKTAILAKEMWIYNWTSSLNISPHKDLNKLFEIWDIHSLKNNLNFLKIAFRKNKWFERSVEYTKKYNIYRQNYCWCIYSDSFPNK